MDGSKCLGEFSLSAAKLQSNVKEITPTQLGSFSLNKNNEYSIVCNQPKLKGKASLPINLNEGFKEWSPPKCSTVLDPLLNWIVLNKFCLDGISVITYRGILKKISICPIDVYKNQWQFRLVKHENVVFMDEIKLQDDIFNISCYGGYKFEKHMVEDQEEDLSEHIVVTSKFDSYRCLFAAEIDAYDHDDKIVEIKTHKVLKSQKDNDWFRKSKLLNTFLQCYLAGIPKCLFGFRDRNNYIQTTQEHTVDEISQICRNDWNKNICMDFLNQILSWIIPQMTSDSSFYLSYLGDKKLQLSCGPKTTHIPMWFLSYLENH